MTKTTEQTLTRIAREVLEIETLATRGSDSLDFHDLAVWSIKAALAAAYQAGVDATASKTARSSANPQKPNTAS